MAEMSSKLLSILEIMNLIEYSELAPIHEGFEALPPQMSHQASLFKQYCYPPGSLASLIHRN